MTDEQKKITDVIKIISPYFLGLNSVKLEEVATKVVRHICKTKPQLKRSAEEMARYEDLADKQVMWICEHGGDEFGYVERYGSVDDEHHYGDGGEAIYKADTEELSRLRQKALGLL